MEMKEKLMKMKNDTIDVEGKMSQKTKVSIDFI